MDAEKQELLDCIFDMDNADIIGPLEDGPQELSHISDLCNLKPDEVLARIAPLVNAGILAVTTRPDSTSISADKHKLAELVESDGNFEGAIDGLAKLDSYLN